MKDELMDVFTENKENELKLRKRLLKAAQQAKIRINTDGCRKLLEIFSKSIQHDKNGVPSKEEIRKLLIGVFEDRSVLNRINYPNRMSFVNPSAIACVSLVDNNKATIPFPSPPALDSAEFAGAMVELFAMALVRDVPFQEYQTNSTIQKVIKDLNQLTDFRGPKAEGVVVPSTLFRGNSNGDLIGPYMYHNFYGEITKKDWDIFHKNIIF